MNKVRQFEVEQGNSVFRWILCSPACQWLCVPQLDAVQNNALEPNLLPDCLCVAVPGFLLAMGMTMQAE